MSAAILRPLAFDEHELLARATLGNMNWCGERFTMDDVLNRPEFAHYATLVEGRWDFGQVAVVDDEVVGVCWALFLPADDSGYGFISKAIPEVSLWVAPEARRQGVGRQLLESLIARAEERGIVRLCLSVEPDNPAKRLYESLGFVDVPGREDDGVMLLDRTEHDAGILEVADDWDVHMDRNTFCWVQVVQFDLPATLDDRAAIAAMIASPGYAWDAASPYLALTGFGKYPVVHGPWRLSAMDAGQYFSIDPNAARAVLDAWARFGEPEWSPSSQALQRLDAVLDVFDRGAVYQLENPGDDRMHEYGFVTGFNGFHEFVVVDRDAALLHLIIASDD